MTTMAVTLRENTIFHNLGKMEQCQWRIRRVHTGIVETVIQALRGVRSSDLAAVVKYFKVWTQAYLMSIIDQICWFNIIVQVSNPRKWSNASNMEIDEELMKIILPGSQRSPPSHHRGIIQRQRLPAVHSLSSHALRLPGNVRQHRAPAGLHSVTRHSEEKEAVGGNWVDHRRRR